MKVIHPLKKALDHLPPLQNQLVLDVGVGKGRVAKPLLAKGAIVTGLDVKDTTFEHENYQHIKTDIKNILETDTTPLPCNYDLITASFVLHFGDRKTSESIVRKLQEHTVKGGHNLLVMFSNEDWAILTNRTTIKKQLYPTMAELHTLYDDWELVYADQIEGDEEDHDGLGPHKHNIIIALLKKNF